MSGACAGAVVPHHHHGSKEDENKRKIHTALLCFCLEVTVLSVVGQRQRTGVEREAYHTFGER